MCIFRIRKEILLMLIKNFFIQAEQGKTDMENYIARLEEEKAGLEKEVSDLNALNPSPSPLKINCGFVGEEQKLYTHCST